MQTFVPYGSDFELNAQCLDRQRLGKQRVETWQILTAFAGFSGWRNHPATKMWASNPDALCHYGMAMCTEWIKRGYNDTMLPRFIGASSLESITFLDLPTWIDNEEIVISHRSNLIRKKPEYYGPMWPDVPDDLPYVWPTNFVFLNEKETYPNE